MAASTTQKLTFGTLALIYKFCVAFNAGVIVRFKGEEIGITADDLMNENGKITWPNAPAKINTLTIPKATIAQLQSDLSPAPVMAVLFSDLEPAAQNEIRNIVGSEMMAVS